MWNPFKVATDGADSLLGQKVAGLLVRHALNALGTLLVSKGLIDQGSWTEVSAGLAVALTSLAWSIYQKSQTEQVIATALTLPAGTSRSRAEIIAKS